MTGTVGSFDDARGYGVIHGDDGLAYVVHCTQIAGGSRSVEPGTRVEFTVVGGRLGQWEAVAVSPTRAAASS